MNIRRLILSENRPIIELSVSQDTSFPPWGATDVAVRGAQKERLGISWEKVLIAL
jgi:hypothetical protein